jgi:hypothetical protein
MTKVAVVAHGALKGNKLFSPEFGRDNSLDRFCLLRESLWAQGYGCGTLDTFLPASVDVLIFHDLHVELESVLHLVKANPEVQLIYIPNEPSIISPMHHESILIELPVDAILTWNDSIAGKYPHVVKCNIGEPCIMKESIPSTPFSARKFICCINSNKSSSASNSLYGERLQAIEFFSSKPCGLDLYGMGWKTSLLPYVKATYRGPCDSKKTVLQSYKFSVCFENVNGLFGLITEKIFDCFAAGTVPIYYGAPNIDKYIPESCYVDFNKFQDYEALYAYLRGMSEDDHKGYLHAAKQFIESPAYHEFTSSQYVGVVIEQLRRLEAKRPIKRSVWKLKRKIAALILRCPSFYSEIRRFRRMILDLIKIV